MKTKESNIVRLTLDPKNPPKLSDEQKEQLKRLAAMPDEAIDYSDAPYLPDAKWTKAVKLTPKKKQITMRLDSEVIDFFKGEGKRYQTHMNAVLLTFVRSQKHS